MITLYTLAPYLLMGACVARVTGVWKPTRRGQLSSSTRSSTPAGLDGQSPRHGRARGRCETNRPSSYRPGSFLAALSSSEQTRSAQMNRRRNRWHRQEY